MKVYVTRSSENKQNGEIREYEDLIDCIKSLFDTEDFGGFEPEIIIYDPKNKCYMPDKAKECEYAAEIYDDWRE